MNKLMLSVLVAVLAIGVMIGYWISPELQVPVVSQKDEGKQPLFYRNPMNPAITSPVPAQDSMGMDYVPVYAEPETGQISSDIQVDPVVVQNMGVRTSRAERGNLARDIRTIGRVTFDEQRMVRLHPKVEGWVEQMWVDKTGQSVSHDDILLSVFSPTLVATQQEYLLALSNFAVLKESPFDEIRQGALDLMQSTRQRLELLDVAEHQIDELQQTRAIKKDLHIHSPATGTVIEIGVRQGQYVTPKTELYRIVDLNQVWGVAAVFEKKLPCGREGEEGRSACVASRRHTVMRQ